MLQMLGPVLKYFIKLCREGMGEGVKSTKGQFFPASLLVKSRADIFLKLVFKMIQLLLIMMISMNSYDNCRE